MSDESVHTGIDQIDGIRPRLSDLFHRKLGKLAGRCAPRRHAKVVEDRAAVTIQRAIGIGAYGRALDTQLVGDVLLGGDRNLLHAQESSDRLQGLQLHEQCDLARRLAGDRGRPPPLIEARSEESVQIGRRQRDWQLRINESRNTL